MKIVSLNVWGGRCGESLFKFVKKYSDVDVFLFQEIIKNGTDKSIWSGKERLQLFEEFCGILKKHTGYFAPIQDNEWGIAIFVSKKYKIVDNGSIIIFNGKDTQVDRDGQNFSKNLQYLVVEINGKKINFLNTRGIWSPNGKIDTEDRINQSKRIVDFVKGLKGEIVLMGDFNLRPDTQSLKIIEDELGLRNLISEFGITSTRTSFYEKEEKFADYTFVSPNIKVKDFQILPDEVSDHAPMSLEF